MDSQVTDQFKPIIIDADDNKKQELLNELQSKSEVGVVDTIENQIRELAIVRNPKLKKDKTYQDDFINEYLSGRSIDKVGAWIFYPWNHLLIHLLPESEFFELRTARNKPIISKSTQEKFYNLVVGVVGLSVGNAIVQNLIYSGGCKKIKIADPDILELSNTNRVAAKVSDLGGNKAIITARQIFEINPYADVQVFVEGLTPENFSGFFLGDPKLDLIIDECDDINLKINMRSAAEILEIPLLMITDNGYESSVDLHRNEPKKDQSRSESEKIQALTELATAMTLSEKLDLTPEEELKMITKVISPESISPEMQRGCIARVNQEVAGWPQLAMTVLIGGSLASYTVLRLANGDKTIAEKTTFSFPKLLDSDFSSDKQSALRKKQTKEFVKFVNSL